MENLSISLISGPGSLEYMDGAPGEPVRLRPERRPKRQHPDSEREPDGELPDGELVDTEPEARHELDIEA
jgi:hypothetical protein